MTRAGVRPGGPVEPDVSGHMPGLDGVRALAVMLVVMHHVFLLTPLQHPVDRAAAVLGRSGWTGVDLFFVLSGFLITGILLDAKSSPRYFRAFYWRRLLRIFPLYYGYLLVVFVLAPALGRAPFEVAGRDEVWFWLYLSNFAMADGWIARGLNHFWTLAIEEQFYLVWPTLVWLLPRRAFTALVGVLLLGVPLLRLVLAESGATPLQIYVVTFTRIDTLAFGAGLALLARSSRGLVRWRPAAWALLAVCLLALLGVARITGGLKFQLFLPAESAWAYSAVAAACGAFVLLVLTSPPRGLLARALSSPAMRGIGRVSYAIYVLHLPVEMTLRALGAHPARFLRPAELHLHYFVLYYALVLAVSWGAAWLSWHLYEKRFLSLKDRISY